MRAILTALCRLLLRIFFRRIDVTGGERVPDAGPVLYVLNHPNGLLDPLFILCLSPRPVTFMAKAPLFHTFLVKHFVRAFECLPVYRASDGEDPSKNRASIEASIALLGAGRALALFPEGKSHSEPWIEPLKTGAARIALAASASTEERSPEPVRIVPVGLDYSEKTTFRSRALLVYGEPIITPRVTLDAEFRPPSEAADELTEAIAEALARVTLQARENEAIELARDARRIWAASERDLAGDAAADPEDESDTDSEAAQIRFELEYRLLAGHAELRERAPALLDAVITRIRRYQAEVALIGLEIDQPIRQRRRALIRELVILPLLAPLALLGSVVHAPAYRLIDWVAHRMAKQAAEVLATIKMAGGLLFFPATWVLMMVAVARTSGWPLALATLVVLPISGYVALRFAERTSALVDRAWALWILMTRRDVAAWLVAERAAIRAGLLGLAAQVDAAQLEAAVAEPAVPDPAVPDPEVLEVH
jgi:glycerol-3-phosphate O-acyltransferase/dihydroxyacetone phosphate acyltransferase